MTRRVRVEVTADDIAKGERRVCGACPLAVAIERATSTPTLVWYRSAFIGGAKADLPAVAQDARQVLDSGGDHAPFAFDLDIPEAP
jgi:hypothetical protein